MRRGTLKSPPNSKGTEKKFGQLKKCIGIKVDWGKAPSRFQREGERGSKGKGDLR